MTSWLWFSVLRRRKPLIALQQTEHELKALREARDWRGAIAVLDDFLRRNPDFNFDTDEIAILIELLLQSRLRRGW